MGAIILDILKLRKLKYKGDKTKFEEAQNDEQQYREQVDAESEKQIFELDKEQKAALKKIFRQATVLCHPDKVSDEFKDDAQAIFIALKQAYDANDTKQVSAILQDLEKGNYFKSRSETVSEKDLIKAAIAKLSKQIKQLETDIIEIKESETYKIVSEIEDWDKYFTEVKEQLQTELESMQLELQIE